MPRPLRAVTRWFHTALDPTVLVALWGVAVAAVLAGAAGGLFDWWSVKDLLPVFGGIIVLLGSYFAARTLSETERDRATQMLASEQAAVRIAGVYRLGEVATYHPRHREYVESVLRTYLATEDQHARRLASALLAELAKPQQASGGDGDTSFPQLIEELRARKAERKPKPGSRRERPDQMSKRSQSA